MKNVYYGLLFLFLVAGCLDSPAVYEYFHAITGESWDRDSIITFSVDIPEPGEYQFGVYARHTVDYSFANLSCYLSVTHPHLQEQQEGIDMTLASSRGKWQGEGNMLKTLFHALPNSYSIDSTGTYTISIRHRMKEKELKGVKNIGLRIVSSQATP